MRTIISLETAGLEGEDALKANRPVVMPEERDITLMQLPARKARISLTNNAWTGGAKWATCLSRAIHSVRSTGELSAEIAAPSGLRGVEGNRTSTSRGFTWSQ